MDKVNFIFVIRKLYHCMNTQVTVTSDIHTTVFFLMIGIEISTQVRSVMNIFAGNNDCWEYMDQMIVIKQLRSWRYSNVILTGGLTPFKH